MRDFFFVFPTPSHVVTVNNFYTNIYTNMGKPNFDLVQALSVLHATLLRLFEWIKELVIRSASGCLQWGSGKLPEVKNIVGKWTTEIYPF